MASLGSEAVALLGEAAISVTPLALAHEQTLPVLPVFEQLLPGGAIRRGSVVEVQGIGATSLALSLAAGPSAAGSWTAIVGMPSIGLMAAAEAGVVLNRVLVVSPPASGSWSAVVAALIGSVDVIMVSGGKQAGSGDLRRITARLRERGSVMIRVGGPKKPSRSTTIRADVELRVAACDWEGLGEGHGVLRHRHVKVDAGGRGASACPRSAEMLLPGPSGAPSQPAPAPAVLFPVQRPPAQRPPAQRHG